MSSPEADPERRRRARRVEGLYLLSGAVAISQEIAWSDILARHLGHGTAAVALVAAIFLGGLALGGAWGGRIAALSSHPLRLFARLEMGIGLLSLTLLFILPRLPLLTAPLGAWIIGGGIPALALRAAIITFLLLPVTLLMGATLPPLARWRAAGRHDAALASGRLAGINAAGGAAGGLLAVFVTLPSMGTSRTLLAAAATSLAVGSSAWLLSRAWRGDVPAAPARRLPEATDEASPPLLPLILVVAGAGSLVAQVGWTRMFAWLLGTTVYSFGILLAASIAGLALGNVLGARPARDTPRPLALYGRLQTMVGAALLLSVAAAPLLPVPLARLADLGRNDPRLLQLGELVLVSALLFPAAILVGAGFPLACRLLAARFGVARGVGRAGAWLTLGNVLGGLAAGFLLPAVVSTRDSLLVAAALFLLAGAGLALMASRRVFSLAPALAMALLFFLVPRWSPDLFASGPVLNGPHYAAAARASGRGLASVMRDRGPLLFVRDGADGLVTVRGLPAGGASLQWNGRTEASTSGDLRSQILAAHFPLLHHPGGRRVLVVGLASGVTVGSVLHHGPDEVVVAELSPGVVEAAAAGFFDQASGSPLADPRVRVHRIDVRTLLQHDPSLYDVIVSQPSNPWVPGVAGLYTLEFLRLAQSRLQPGGIFGQWLQAYGVEDEDFRSIVRTFAEVFPHVALYEESVAGGDYFLVGAEHPVALQPAALQARLGPAVAGDLARVGLVGPAAVLVRRVLDGGRLRRFAGGAPLLDDDGLRLAYSTPLTMWRETAAARAESLERFRPQAMQGLRLDDLPPVAAEALRRAVATEERDRRSDRRFLRLADGTELARSTDPRVSEALALTRAGLFREAYARLADALAGAPGPAVLELLAGDLAARLGEPEIAEVHYRAVLAEQPQSVPALTGLGLQAFRRGKGAEAADHFRLALEADPADPEAALGFGAVLLGGGNARASLPWLERAVNLDPDSPRAWSNLGVARRRLGQADAAEEAYRRAVDLDPFLSTAWYNLGVVLQQRGAQDAARAAFEQGLQVDPDDCDLQRALQGIDPERVLSGCST